MAELKIKEGMIFISADGDGIGKQVGRAVIANDVDELHKVSARIDAAQDFILHWCQHHDGIKISGGGDEFTAALPKEAEEHIESLRKDIEHAFGYTISVGVGSNLAEAGTALLVAKLRGKNRIVKYSEEIKYDIKKAKRRVREKRASPDEYKLSEAYLKKAEGMNEQDCPYCQQTDGIDPSHCKWCHDLEAAPGEEDCPYCKESQQAAMGNENDCPFCNETHGTDEKCPLCPPEGQAALESAPSLQTPSPEERATATGNANGEASEQATKIQSPDSNNAQAPHGSPDEKAQYDQMGMNPPIIGKPTPGNNTSPAGVGEGTNSAAYGTTETPVAPASAGGDEAQSGQVIMPEDNHSKEAMHAIAERIEGETADGKPDDKQTANAIDDTQVVGNGSEANISRPGGFEANAPGDTGLDSAHPAQEDGSPDLSAVLKEGLEDKSNDIDKDRVRDMVGQALNGFKTSKDILERAREQAPDFYQANIAMLAAMIKMAEMLGLGGGGMPVESGQESGQPVQSPQSPQSAHDWEEPFSPHPERGGKEKPGHSSKEGDGKIGQPIGKLPSKATEHVARTPLPPGSINAKGQQKVIDPKTGKTRFIDRKHGMVQSPTGVPIKPPSRGSNGAQN